MAQIQFNIAYGTDDPVITLLTQLLRKASDMGTTIVQISATLDEVKANQDTQTALLNGLVQEVGALRANGTGATDADLANLETKLVQIRDAGAASIASVPAEDLPPAPSAPSTPPVVPPAV